jgi:hypothetical protein
MQRFDQAWNTAELEVVSLRMSVQTVLAPEKPVERLCVSFTRFDQARKTTYLLVELIHMNFQITFSCEWGSVDTVYM